MNDLRSHIKNRKSVSSDIQTPRSRSKKLGCASIFQQLLGFGYPDETIFLVFDILQQTYQEHAEEVAFLNSVTLIFFTLPITWSSTIGPVISSFSAFVGSLFFRFQILPFGHLINRKLNLNKTKSHRSFR